MGLNRLDKGRHEEKELSLPLQRRLLMNLVADIKIILNLYFNKLVITITTSLFLASEFIDTFSLLAKTSIKAKVYLIEVIFSGGIFE